MLVTYAGKARSAMKPKLTITVDSQIVPAAKRHARALGMSLSSLIEKSLREVIDADKPSFASRWRGRFREAERDDAHHAAVDSQAPSMILLDTEALIDVALDRDPHAACRCRASGSHRAVG